MKRRLLLIPILLTLTSCGLSNALQLFNIRHHHRQKTVNGYTPCATGSCHATAGNCACERSHHAACFCPPASQLFP